MAQGKRETALMTLVNQLDALDTRRRALVAQIQAAAAGLGTSTGPTGSASGNRGGRRPGFKLSPEARAKIAAAQKKRWARQRAEKKA